MISLLNILNFAPGRLFLFVLDLDCFYLLSDKRPDIVWVAAFIPAEEIVSGTNISIRIFLAFGLRFLRICLIYAFSLSYSKNLFLCTLHSFQLKHLAWELSASV